MIKNLLFHSITSPSTPPGYPTTRLATAIIKCHTNHSFSHELVFTVLLFKSTLHDSWSPVGIDFCQAKLVVKVCFNTHPHQKLRSQSSLVRTRPTRLASLNVLYFQTFLLFELDLVSLSHLLSHINPTVAATMSFFSLLTSSQASHSSSTGIKYSSKCPSFLLGFSKHFSTFLAPLFFFYFYLSSHLIHHDNPAENLILKTLEILMIKKRVERFFGSLVSQKISSSLHLPPKNLKIRFSLFKSVVWASRYIYILRLFSH